MADPTKYLTMTIEEVRSIFGKSRSTIYRWLDEGCLKRAHLGKKQGSRRTALILTKSVIKMHEENSE